MGEATEEAAAVSAAEDDDTRRKRVLDQLPVGLWVARAPGGEVIYANHVFREILGMGEVQGVGIGEAPATYGIYDRQGNLYPVEDLPFSRALREGRSVTVDDLVIHRKDGSRAHVRAFANPVRAHPEAPVSFVIVVFIDISAEIAAIVNRQVAEERLAFAIDHAPVIFFTLDRQGVLTFCAGAGLKGLGVSAPQLVGRSVYDIYPQNAEVVQNLKRVMGGQTVTATSRLGDGIIESFLTPLRTADGQIVGVTGVSSDVTEQRRLQAKAIQSDRIMAMGTLAASVAHEINNPLTYILGSVDEIERHIARLSGADAGAGVPEVLRPDLQSMRERLREIRTGAERVRDVARDLRSFARPDDETVSAVQLSGVARAVLELVRKEIEARARLVLDLQETPAVRGNEARLVQVILNLLVNAWQALEPGNVAGHEIGLRTLADGRRALIEVWDSGPGIPVEQRERIFDPFFTTKPIGQGTGLGLFVCRNIVNAFGGSITVHDGPRGGALFRVTLPAAVTPAMRRMTPPVGTGPSTDRTGVAPGFERTGRILIVDDDEWVARTLAQALSPRYNVTVARGGAEAVDLLTGGGPGFDLAYCDLMMNDVTGMDIYDRIAERAPTLLPRLVFMTGGAFTPRAARFVEERQDVVVHKPFDIVAETRRRLETE